MNRSLRYFKFNVVGAMGMGVQLVALSLFHRLMHGHYLPATFFAVELAVVHNFIWHLKFTWRDRGGEMDPVAAFWRFQLINGAVSLVGNLVLMWVFVRVARLPVLAANALSIGCCSMVNFWVAEVWAFAGVESCRRLQIGDFQIYAPPLRLSACSSSSEHIAHSDRIGNVSAGLNCVLHEGHEMSSSVQRVIHLVN